MAGRLDTQVAGYRIESLIARGGMGEVYLAEQDAPRRKVALKLLSPELSLDAGFRERFARESEAAASIDHPNVIPIYQSGQADGALFIAMRYVEGTDLRALLAEQGPLPPERAVRICAQIADALEAAHERSLVHRDVKPANILVGRADHTYLSDFGLIRRSEVSTAITKTGQFMGTIDYVAPEQIKGQAVDGRADIYSLGCVLYECLTGEPPFRRETEVATLYAHLENPMPRPSERRHGIPSALDGVVAKATAKRPGDRFESAHAFAAAASAADGLPPRGPKPRLRWVVGAAVAVIAIAAVGAVLVNDESPTTQPTSETGAGSIPLDSLVQVDAETGEILAVVPAAVPPLTGNVGGLPELESGEGGIWLLFGDVVNRVDPATGSLVESIDLGAGLLGADSIAVGYRTVWVGAPPGIARIDPIDNEHLRPVRLFATPTFSGIEVALGGSSVWAVTGDGKLTRVDPATGERIATSDIGQTASGIAFGFDGIWVIDELQATLTHVDPVTLEADGDPMQAPGETNDLAVGAGAVWILDSSAGVVAPYDPQGGRFGAPIRVGSGPSDLAVGLDAVWTANQSEGTVSRVDTVTGAVQTIDVGAPTAAIAVDESSRSLWIAIAEIRSE